MSKSELQFLSTQRNLLLVHSVLFVTFNQTDLVFKFQIRKMVTVKIVRCIQSKIAKIQVWITKIPLYLEFQFNLVILPIAVIALRILVTIFIAGIFTGLTGMTLSLQIIPGSEVRLPLYFTFSKIEEELGIGHSSFRESTILQANVSLVSKKSFSHLLGKGTEYSIILELELPENSKNYQVMKPASAYNYDFP